MLSTIKASQSLSVLMETAPLIAALLKLAIETSGAGRGLFLLHQAADGPASDRFRIEAEARLDAHGAVAFLPPTSTVAAIGGRLPHDVFDKVARSQTMVALDDASGVEFADDPDFLAARPGALCCLPLAQSGLVFGVLYLEGRQRALFTPDRVAVLQALIAQTEISWHNLALFHQIRAENCAYRCAQDEALDALQRARQRMTEAEKMAALGCLVAGVAHEINTPVGVGVTAASSLQGAASHLARLYRQGKMKKADLERFLDEAEETSQMILENLARAADLIHSFKQVAVDQSSEAKREFNVKTYLHEIMTSLTPTLKTTALRCDIECLEDIQMLSYPGAFSQIVSNLIMNAIMHAYEPGQAGVLTIRVAQDDQRVKLWFVDDGKGIAPENLGKIYEPFFTTRRGSGGSGLGLGIVRKLVEHNLQGDIACHSEIGKGTMFEITMALAV